MKQVIDFDALGKYIQQIEDIFDKDGIDVVSQTLILNETLKRIQTKIQKQKAQDLADNVSVGGLIGKVTKSLYRRDNE